MQPLLVLVALSVSLLVLVGCGRSALAPDASGSPVLGKSRFARCGTNRVHYVTAGKKQQPVILFVHCWSGSSEFWREQVPALVDRARLILVDLPGHGRSDQPQTGYAVDDLARAVLAVLEDARVDQATLVGHSMGTPVICRVHAQAPQRVAALVAVDGLLRRPVVQPEEAEAFLAPFRGPDYRKHVAEFIGSMFPNPGTEALRDRVVADILATPQHVMCATLEGMFRTDQPAWDLPKVQVPVLVLNAPNPMWTPDYEAYARSRSGQTEYRMVPGTGHFLMLEQPAAFNAALSEMLRQHGLIAN